MTPPRPASTVYAVKPASSATAVSPSGPFRRDAAQHVRAGEARDERVRRARDELRRRGDLEQPAVDEDTDPVGERGRVVEVVRHEHRRQRELLEQLSQLRAHVRPRVRVESGERLVEQQDPGVARERARERDPLPLAARDRRRPGVGEVADAEALEQLACPRPCRRTRRSPRTLRCGKSAYSWKTRPTRRRSGGTSMPLAVSSQRSSPSRTTPRSGRRSPAIARSTLDLPAPGRADERDGLRPELEL